MQILDDLDRLSAYEQMLWFEASADAYQVLAILFATFTIAFVMSIAVFGLLMPERVIWTVAFGVFVFVGFEWASIRLAFYCREEYQKAKKKFYRVCGV